MGRGGSGLVCVRCASRRVAGGAGCVHGLQERDGPRSPVDIRGSCCWWCMSMSQFSAAFRTNTQSMCAGAWTYRDWPPRLRDPPSSNARAFEHPRALAGDCSYSSSQIANVRTMVELIGCGIMCVRMLSLGFKSRKSSGRFSHPAKGPLPCLDLQMASQPISVVIIIVSIF